MTKAQFFKNDGKVHLVQFSTQQEAYEIFDYLKDHPLCKKDQIPQYEEQWEQNKSEYKYIGILYTSKNASHWDFVGTPNPNVCPYPSEVISFSEFNEMISTITNKYIKKHL